MKKRRLARHMTCALGIFVAVGIVAGTKLRAASLDNVLTVDNLHAFAVRK